MISSDQHIFQAFLPRADIPELPHLIAHEFFDGCSALRGNRGACVFKEGVDVLVGYIRDVAEIVWCSTGEELGGGVAMDEFEDPAQGNIPDAEGEFGEAEREPVMQLIDEPGALANDRLEPPSNLA